MGELAHDRVLAARLDVDDDVRSGSARWTAASTASAAAWPWPDGGLGRDLDHDVGEVPARRLRASAAAAARSAARIASIACRAAASASAGARSISTSTFRRIRRTGRDEHEHGDEERGDRVGPWPAGADRIRPISTASEPTKSLPKCSAFESSAALLNRRAVRSEISVRETSIASTIPITTKAHQAASTWIAIAARQARDARAPIDDRR